jgi:hypothetical protein
MLDFAEANKITDVVIAVSDRHGRGTGGTLSAT